MGDHETVKDFEGAARFAGKALRGKAVGDRGESGEADCKRHPPVETNPHQVVKVLGLVSRQGLLLVADLESPPIACCKLSVMVSTFQVVAVYPLT